MSKERIDQLNEQTFNSIYKNLKKAEETAKTALEMAEAEDYSEGKAWARLNLGLLEMEIGRYEDSNSELKKAHTLFVEIGDDYRGWAAVLNALGLLNIRMGRMHKAFFYLQDSLDICGRHSVKDIEFKALNHMGIHQFRSEKYNQALRFFQKSLEINSNDDNTSLLNNLGSTYRALKQNEKALKCLSRALENSERFGRADARISIYEEIGLTYSQMKDFDRAVDNLEKALELCIGQKRRHSPDILIHLAEQHMEQQNADKAEEILLRTLELINDSNRISHRRLYLLLSKIEEGKGNSEQALSFLKVYMELTESLKSDDLDEEVWQMETAQYRALNRRISTVAETGRKLTALLFRDDIIHTLKDSLASLFDIDSCAVGIMEGGGLNLHYYNLLRKEHGLKHVEIDRQKDISSWVIKNNRDLMINNMDADIGDYLPDYDRSTVSFDIQSALCIPFETEKTRGVLGIYSHNRNTFNDEDREFLAMFSSYAAIAFDNATQTEIIRSKNRELTQLNKYDGLTEIFNRRHLLHTLEQNWKSCRRTGNYLHVMIMDADHFKDINDNFGHDTGDICLKKLASVLRDNLKRSSDCYGRYGGEEFLISVQDMSEEDAFAQAERIRTEVEKIRIPVSGFEINMTVSIGIGSAIPSRDRENPSLENLIKTADKNMYLSKSSGRNMVSSSAPLL